MNQREQQEKELKHLHQTIEAIEECMGEALLNDDGDTVIPEFHADRINMLLAGA